MFIQRLRHNAAHIAQTPVKDQYGVNAKEAFIFRL